MAERESIFSKFNVKDYNVKLEQILEKKHYNPEAENLLLSMFYKIENAYKDYCIVKNDTVTLNEFREELIKIIEEDCDKIEIIEPKPNEKTKNYIINKPDKTIKVFPNEENLLYSLLIIQNKKIKKADFFSRYILNMLQEGIAISKTSVISDFTGWSWNTGISRILNLEYNVIYNNILFILDNNFILENQKNRKIEKSLQEELEQRYGKLNANEFMVLLYKVLAGAYSNISSKKRKIVYKELVLVKNELEKLENHDEYIKQIITINANKLKQIGYIDRLLSNIGKIRIEFKRYNMKNSQNQVFSISDYIEKLENDRREIIELISKNQDLINPIKYIQRVSEIKRRLELLKELNIDKNVKIKLDKDLINLQKVFLKMYISKIKQTETKKDIINLLYEYRYYNYLPYKKKTKLKNDTRLEADREKVSKVLIEKMESSKVIEKISNDMDLNYIILRYIFNTKMIKLENMNIKINKNIDKLEVEYYDIDMLEDKIEIDLKQDPILNIKTDKKIKIFV